MISPSLRSMGILGVFLIASTCQAGSVTATLGTPINNGSDTVSINDGNASATLSNYNYSGAIPWTQSSPINPAIGHPSFYTFCIELTQNAIIGHTYTYQLTPLANAPIPGSSQTGGALGMGLVKADAISRLWNGAYGTSAVNGNATADLLKGAAFQLALWRIEYDMNSSGQVSTDFTVSTTANFRASSSVSGLITQAMAFLDSVNAATGNYSESALLASGLHLTALTSDTLQDQVTATPEPSSICIAVVGSLLFGGLAFKRRKKAALAQI